LEFFGNFDFSNNNHSKTITQITQGIPKLKKISRRILVQNLTGSAARNLTNDPWISLQNFVLSVRLAVHIIFLHNMS
jgi:hypothetical protein